MTRQTMAALAAVLVLGAAIRFHHLGRESLWIDEVLSVEVARRPWPALLAATAEDGHPPLYATLLHVWLSAFGESETALRSLSAALGVASVAAFFALASRLLSARAALVGTLLLASAPYTVYYAQEVRNYSLLLLLTLLSYLGLVAWDERPTMPRAAAYAGATVLLLYTHVFGFLVWAAQLLWLAVRIRRGADWRTRLPPCIAIGALVLPWLAAPWTALLLRQTDARTTALHLARPTVWTLIASAYQFAGSPPAAAILVPAAALEVYRGLATRDPVRPEVGPEGRTTMVLLLLWAAVPQLVPFAISLVAVPIYITRATIVTLPVLYLLAAGGLGRLGGRAQAALVAVAVLASLGYQALYFQGRAKEQWREVAGVVDAGARPGDVVLFDAGYGRRGFDYYSRVPSLRRVSLASDITSPAGAAEVAALPADTRRLWVVRFQRPPGGQRVVEALAGRFRLGGRAAYRGIELFLFDRGP